MNLVKLEVGDWSDDGHGKTETIIIESNLSSSGISNAYYQGCKIVGKDSSSKRISV